MNFSCRIKLLLTAALCATGALFMPLFAVASSVQENPVQVRAWNRFADRLHSVHRLRLQRHEVRVEEQFGGYADIPQFYREVSYIDAEAGRPLSRIRWERRQPDKIHDIELYFYDEEGRLEREYSATYLPRFRNAPIQTLVNLYSYNDGLTAFRQFDAAGARIFEHCTGSWFNEKVSIAIDEPLVATPDTLLESEPYIACFGSMPISTGNFLDLSAGTGEEWSAPGKNGQSQSAPGNPDERIAILSLNLRFQKGNAHLLLERCQAYFEAQNFDASIRDCDRTLSLDNTLDDALFWRGMARGRAGDIEAGIGDLTLYLDRHPDSSLGHTKRGVRHIWNGDFDSAERDLIRAIELDGNNAEAHDDLGVLLANRRDYDGAIRHFRATIRLAPDYQKAHENLALVLHILGRNDVALEAVETALALGTDNRSAVLLKGNILGALGKNDEARQWTDRAESMPRRNWSETFTLRAD